jgi:hypothetical protein
MMGKRFKIESRLDCFRREVFEVMVWIGPPIFGAWMPATISTFETLEGAEKWVEQELKHKPVVRVYQ